MTILGELTRQGISVKMKGGKIVLSAPKGVITPAVVGKVAAHKAEVMAMLTGRERPAIPPAPAEVTGVKGGLAPTMPAIPPPPADPRAEADEIAHLEDQAAYPIDWLLPDGRPVSGAYLVAQWTRLGKPVIATPRATIYLLPQWLDGDPFDPDFLDKLTAVVDWLGARCSR